MQLSVLTFNIWDAPFWVSCARHERIHRLGSYLKGFQPDIVCLQEAFDIKHREEVHNAIGRHTYFTTDRCDHTRRVFFLSRLDLTGGLVVYSKFPILNSRFIPFRLTLLTALAERISRRGFLEVMVKTPLGPLLVISTHLYSRDESGHANSMRRSQLSQILDFVKKRRSKVPVVLAGDLNEDKIMEKEPFSILFRKAKFIESTAYTGESPQPTYRPENPLANTRFNRTTTPKRFDYVLFRNISSYGLGVASNHVLAQPTRPISDHDPVIVTLTTEKHNEFSA